MIVMLRALRDSVLDRRVISHRWSAPVAVLGFALATTNPQPILLGSAWQRTFYLLMGVAALMVAVRPTWLIARDVLAAASTLACAWRTATLVFESDGVYDPNEVLAFATVWIVIGTLVLAMTIVTWPAVVLGKERDRAHAGSE